MAATPIELTAELRRQEEVRYKRAALPAGTIIENIPRYYGRLIRDTECRLRYIYVSR